MKSKNLIFEKVVNALIYFGIFTASLYVPLDPDLGWHLKYGEYFFENGRVLRDNLYTALMPSFQWNNSSWLTDLITYQTFNNLGFIGLSILGALVITATFFFLGKAAKLNLFEKSIIFPIILYLVSPVNQVSFRGQLLSLLLLSILYYILSKYEKNKKIILLLIPIFMVWGNLHGQYILGLGIFFIWFSVYLIKETYLNYKSGIKKLIVDNKFLLSSFVGSSLAILINPFGPGVYEEAFGHFDDPLQQSVTEFLAPADFSAVWWHLLFAGMILTIGIALLGTGKKNLDKAPFYVPSLILFIFTFWIRRYAWTFYYSCVFLFQPVVKFLEPENKKYSLWASAVISVLFLICTIYIKYPFTELKNMNWNEYCKNSVGCSPTAVQTVIDNNLNNDKLLTIYDYGGYLIWNYPEIKPTIDGRMHLWRDEKGVSAFEYYFPIEQNTTKDIDSSAYNAVLTSHRKPIYGRLVELSEQRKWKVLHVDKYSAVFVRINN